MALYIRRDEQRSQLQERLAAEMAERAKAKLETPPPDGVDDSAYIKGTKPTTTLAWAWIIIVVLAVAAALYVILTVNS